VVQRSRFWATKAFQSAPQPARGRTWACSGSDGTLIRVDPEIAAADEVDVAVIEVVVGPLVDADPLRGQPVPD